MAKTQFKDIVTYEQCRWLKPCWHCAYPTRMEYDKCGDALAKKNFYDALEKADREKVRKMSELMQD